MCSTPCERGRERSKYRDGQSERGCQTERDKTSQADSERE